MKRALISILVILALGAPTAAAPLPPERGTWLELRTENFVLVGNVSERKLAEVGDSLERFRAVLSRLRPGLRLNSPVPVKVNVLANEKSFRPYKGWRGSGEESLLGYFLSNPYGDRIAFNAYPRQGGSSAPIVHHEYTHAFVRHNYPGLPLWLNEGLAEYYSTFAILGDEVQIGAPIARHVHWLKRNSFLELERLFAIEFSSPEYNETSKKGSFYAQSWGLVHYLLNGDPELQEGAVQFLRLLNEGKAPKSAVRGAFGFSLDELESRLRRYVNGRTFGFYTLRLDELPAPTAYKVRQLSRAEALAEMGILLAHAGPPAEVPARRHFEAALEVDPRDPTAHLGLGLVEMLGQRPLAAEPHLQQAISLGSQDPLAYLLAGTVAVKTLRANRDPSATPGLARRARLLLERAKTLDPSFGEVYFQLGLTYFQDGEDANAGVAPMLEAAKRLPDRGDAVFNAAMLLLRAGRQDEAEGLILGPLSFHGEDELLEQAQRALARSRLVEATNAAIQAGDLATAVRLYEDALSTATDPAVAASMEEELERLRGDLEHQGWVDGYNEAVELARSGQMRQALTRLRVVVEECEDPALRDLARALERELEAALR